MSDNVYTIDTIVGSSTESISDAIRKGIRAMAETKRNTEWFQVDDIRGHVQDGEVAHFQVTLKVGFRLDTQE